MANGVAVREKQQKYFIKDPANFFGGNKLCILKFKIEFYNVHNVAACSWSID